MEITNDLGPKQSGSNHLFELDDEGFNFKPMTEGLGFNENAIGNESELRISTLKGSIVTEAPVRSKEELLSQMSSRALPSSQQVIDKSCLTSIYQNEQKKPVKRKKQTVTEASVAAKFLAWSIDLFLIVFIFSMLIFATKISLSLTWFEISNIATRPVMVKSAFLLLFTIYMIYFTILDLGTTFGKEILAIRVRKSKGKVSILDTFLRSIFTLSSILTLGLASLLDFHGKLTDTKVVRNLNVK